MIDPQICDALSRVHVARKTLWLARAVADGQGLLGNPPAVYDDVVGALVRETMAREMECARAIGPGYTDEQGNRFYVVASDRRDAPRPWFHFQRNTASDRDAYHARAVA
jgi:hypothetical protein